MSSLTKYDIVLTTYDTVLNETAKNTRDTAAGLSINSVEWLRVILDEGKTASSRAVI